MKVSSFRFFQIELNYYFIGRGPVIVFIGEPYKSEIFQIIITTYYEIFIILTNIVFIYLVCRKFRNNNYI